MLINRDLAAYQILLWIDFLLTSICLSSFGVCIQKFISMIDQPGIDMMHIDAIICVIFCSFEISFVARL
jgi:hypothetical protein